MVETVNIQAENKGPSLEEESQSQDAAAEQVEEPKLAGEEDAPERPEWLPEKFKSPEDMAKAYAEMEKKLGSGEQTSEEQAETQEAAEEAVEAAGLDMDSLSAEYNENGELSDESYEALAAAGIPREMVDAYVAGQEALADGFRNELLEPVGGQENYDEMVGWAADNLPEAEIDAFNAAIESSDPNQMRMAVENLSNKYTSETGTEPGRMLNGRGGQATGSAYESTADLMKDMGNPEYATNPAFRAKVEAKLARSSIL